jgi:hypothetical protein
MAPRMASRQRRVGISMVMLAAMCGFSAAPRASASADAEMASAVAVKAAFVYNFAKFAEWPALPADAPILFCVVGDNRIADALIETVRGQTIGAHALDVVRPVDVPAWHRCHVLFVGEAEWKHAAIGLSDLKSLPVLTVSDEQGFARGDGMIELYVDSGRMRFAINVDAAEHAGLRLSSRLLGLAKVVRNDDGK